MKREVSGISVRAFKISEALLNAKLSLSFSDAKRLCARTRTGRIKYRKFRDLFVNILTDELKQVLEQKESKVARVSHS